MEQQLFKDLEGALRLGATPEKIKSEVQHAAWQTWKEQGYRGTIEAATGVGKSKVAIEAIKNLFNGRPNYIAYICVPTETLRDVEWPAEIKKWYPTATKDILDRIKLVCHVSMKEVRENRLINLVIFDEVHHITAENSSFFENNQVDQIIGLSATVPTVSFEGSFDKPAAIKRLCPVVFRVSINEAKALKLISDFEIIILKFDLNSTDLSVSYTSGKTIHKTTEASNYKRLTKTLARSMYAKNKGNWKFSMMQQRAAFVRNFPTKTKIAKDVLKHIITDDNRTLVFCGSIEQSIELCGDKVYNSKSSKVQLQAFTNKQINYLGAVMALNEGKNIPDLDQIFIVQISGQARDLVQRIGRTVRWKEGLIAKVIILVAANTLDEKWCKSALKGVDPKLIKTHIVKPSPDDNTQGSI